MTKSVYQKFEASFSNVSAYAILKDGVHCANITLKYPKDGMGRLQCYIHILGTEMQNGQASGYGYDKRSHAIHVTAKKYKDYLNTLPMDTKIKPEALRLVDILASDSADNGWDDNLYSEGFTKINVI